jgi:hypothetical protein
MMKKIGTVSESRFTKLLLETTVIKPHVLSEETSHEDWIYFEDCKPYLGKNEVIEGIIEDSGYTKSCIFILEGI